jgi:phosphatidylglycerol:prolipoprotein diacylglycerol transferase
MFYHNINPVLINVGPMSIRYYGLIYATGFIISYFFLLYLVKKESIKNLTEKNLDLYFIYLMISVVIGARLFEVIFYNLPYYLSNPMNIFKIWNGGLSFHGGITGALITTYYFCKKYKIKFFAISDALSIPASFALFLGRIANFLNGELYGTLTNIKTICIDYTKSNFLRNPPMGCRHPSQLYEAAKNLFNMGILSFLYFNKSIKHKLKQGQITFLFIFLYGLLRLLTNFYRADKIIFLNLTMGQLLCIPMIIIGAIGFFWIQKRK